MIEAYSAEQAKSDSDYINELRLYKSLNEEFERIKKAAELGEYETELYYEDKIQVQLLRELGYKVSDQIEKWGDVYIKVSWE